MKEKNFNKTIGILGGMGPAASANLYQKIVSIAQAKYKAEQDSDFPEIILYSLPIKGFDETGFTDPGLVKEQLVSGVKKLEEAGSDFVIIACNTVHYFYNQMQSVVQIPIISMIDETIKVAQSLNVSTVGILSSESTRDLLLYQSKCKKAGVKAILTSPKQQKSVNHVILNVMRGAKTKNDADVLNGIVQSMAKKGAEAIIIGCTELPLVIGQKDIELPLLNPTNIITESALAFANMN